MHAGIAQTALAAWLDARAHEGQLLLRVEDIDQPRVVPGAEADILRDLEWLGLDWDGPVVRQSERYGAYASAIDTLREQGRIFACTCSRKEVREAAAREPSVASAPHGADGPRYPGTCRDGHPPRPGRTPSLRLRTEAGDRCELVDRRLGPLSQDVHAEVGDFVLRRADELWAYQLAVTVDDLQAGVTSIVRGEDLFGSSPRQLLLRRLLEPEAADPVFLHTPLVLDEDGKRLAKRDGATALARRREARDSAERIIGELAFGLGLIDRPEPCAPRDLLSVWSARYPPRAHRS